MNFLLAMGRVLLVGCVFSVVAFGQKPADSTSRTETAPNFSTRTELVLVPVTVRNKDKAVTGLRKDRFSIEDNGDNRQISFFEEVRTDSSATPRSKSARQEYTNYVAASPAEQNIRLIVFDLLNSPFLDQPRMSQAYDAVLKYLADNVDPNEPTAMLLMTQDGLKQVHSFSTGNDVLVAALKGTRNRRGAVSSGGMVITPPATSPVSGDGAFAEALAAEMALISQALNRSEEVYRRQRTSNALLDTMRNFEAIALSYQGIPGRKSLVWITLGCDLIGDGNESGTRRDREWVEYVIHRLNGANISVYPIDITGMAFPFVPPNPLNDMADPRTTPANPTSDIFTSDTEFRVRESLKLVAAETGGKPCVNDNDTKDCVARAHDDAAVTYMLGFYIPTTDRTPGWHTLEVKVKADYSDLRHRKGYLINESGKGNKITAPPQSTIKEVINTPYDFTSVPIRAALIDTKNGNGRLQVKYKVTLPPGSFSINDNIMHVQLSAVVLDDKGKYITEQSKNIRGVLKPETLSRLTAEGFSYDDTLELPTGRYQLKWVVRDELTGEIGSVTAPVELR